MILFFFPHDCTACVFATLSKRSHNEKNSFGNHHREEKKKVKTFFSKRKFEIALNERKINFSMGRIVGHTFTLPTNEIFFRVSEESMNQRNLLKYEYVTARHMWHQHHSYTYINM